MKDNGYVYYGKNSNDVRDQRFLSESHARLHKRFGDKVIDKISAGAEFLTEKEIEDGFELSAE